MLHLPGSTVRLCDGVSRRDLLRAGSLGLAGLSLSSVLRGQAQGAAGKAKGNAPADAVILVYCWGAPSQFEIFDPKPEAPAEVRGEFGITKTHVPGAVLGERIPLLAQRGNLYSIVRTCTQSSTSHQPGAYEALTGYKPTANAVALTATSKDYPNLGCVVSKLAPRQNELPPFVTLPQLISDVGNLTPGQFAGYLGKQHEALAIVRDPNAQDFSVEEVMSRPEVTSARLDDRKSLLELVDAQAKALEGSAAIQNLDTFQDRAFRLLTSEKVKQAFDLNREKSALRDRYGRHTFGQSCLMARRLVESGVKLVTVFSANGGKIPQDAWDTHSNNFTKLKTMLPPFDQGTSALLDDLHERGLLKRTLLVVMSEFGRSPKINAGAGRDHWSNCYSIMLAGAGVKGGHIYGQSDTIGAHPKHGRVFNTADLTATVFNRLGIDHHAELHDQTGRPLPASTGEPMVELF